MSSSHSDYYIKDGKLIGRFEELYQDVDDPWGCSRDVDYFNNRLFVAALESLALDAPRILDVGCGLGKLTNRISERLNPQKIDALDISATAVEKASQAYPHIDFFCHDMVKTPRLDFADDTFDLICTIEILWCILPNIENILAELARVCKAGGYLALMSGFLPPEEQTYGKDKIQSPQQVWNFIEAAGFKVVHAAEMDKINPKDSYKALMIAFKP